MDAMNVTKAHNFVYQGKLSATKFQAANIRGGPSRATTNLWVRVKADLFGIVQAAGKDPQSIPQTAAGTSPTASTAGTTNTTRTTSTTSPS